MTMLETERQVVMGALSLLDDIATSDESMGTDDIDDLCAARKVLADLLGFVYNEDMNRYEPPQF